MKSSTLFLLPFFPTLVLSAIPSNLYSDTIYTKYANVAGATQNPTSYPHTSNGATWAYTGADWWASSFFSGTLYLLNTRSTKCPGHTSTNFLNLGRRWSRGIAPLIQGNSVGHDQGFLSFPFLEELTLNPNNQTAKNIVAGFSKLLANRYSSVVGCTKSWESSSSTEFKVIIDNMMNLELLLINSQLTGDQSLRNMAISHADKTLANHLRADGSSYHVVTYNANTGAVISRTTSQGYANSSTWTRGQAWGIYGFAMMYKYTQLTRYLETARKMAQVFVSRLPSSGVPPWDFDAPSSTNPPRDTSAATIAASGLLLLSQGETSVGNSTGATRWNDAATKLLTDTINLAWQPNWQPILSDGTSNRPSGSYNTGLSYGDYYFVKAGNILLDMGLATCSAGTAALEERSQESSQVTNVRARSFGKRHKAAVQHRRELLDGEVVSV